MQPRAYREKRACNANTGNTNIKIFIVTKNSRFRRCFRYQLYLEYTGRERNLTSHVFSVCMADKRVLEEQQCNTTTPRGARQLKRRRIVNSSPLSDTARRLLLHKCSDSGHGSRESAVSTMVVEPVSSPTAVWLVSWLALEQPCGLFSSLGDREYSVWRANSRATMTQLTFNGLSVMSHPRGRQTIFSNNKNLDI